MESSQRRVISLLVDNQSGVLARVSDLCQTRHVIFKKTVINGIYQRN